MSGDFRNTILLGDVRSTLRTLPERCVLRSLAKAGKKAAPKVQAAERDEEEAT